MDTYSIFQTFPISHTHIYFSFPLEMIFRCMRWLTMSLKEKIESLKSLWNLLDSLNYGQSSSVGLLFGLLVLETQSCLFSFVVGNLYSYLSHFVSCESCRCNIISACLPHTPSCFSLNYSYQDATMRFPHCFIMVHSMEGQVLLSQL